MVTIKFKIKKDVYEFTAETPFKAMEMCNRQVIDKLNLHPMIWDKSGPNAYTYQFGNFFD